MLRHFLLGLGVSGMLLSTNVSRAQEGEDEYRDSQRSNQSRESDNDDEQYRDRESRNQSSRNSQSNREQQYGSQQRDDQQQGRRSQDRQDEYQGRSSSQYRDQYQQGSDRFSQQQQGRRGQSSGSDEAGLGVTLSQSSREARVVNVMPGSPAQRAGLRTGDEILSIDDEPIESSRDVVEQIGEKDPGSWIAIEIERNGSRRTLETRLESRQEALASQNNQFNQSRTSRSFSDDSSGRLDRGQQFGQPQYGQQQYSQSSGQRSSQQGNSDLQRQMQTLQRQLSSLQQEVQQLRSQMQNGNQSDSRRRSSEERFGQREQRDEYNND